MASKLSGIIKEEHDFLCYKNKIKIWFYSNKNFSNQVREENLEWEFLDSMEIKQLQSEEIIEETKSICEAYKSYLEIFIKQEGKKYYISEITSIKEEIVNLDDLKMALKFPGHIGCAIEKYKIITDIYKILLNDDYDVIYQVNCLKKMIEYKKSSFCSSLNASIISFFGSPDNHFINDLFKIYDEIQRNIISNQKNVTLLD